MMDNFSGHKISYVPTNIKIVFFEPNVTSYVQLLDAGIICYIKADYQKEFCHHAVDMDEAGEEDIYKINLLEVMLMLHQAWDVVTKEMIINCWRHTQITKYIITISLTHNTTYLIQHYRSSDSLSTPGSDATTLPDEPKQAENALVDPETWAIIKSYASGIINTFLKVEEKLTEYLGIKHHYNNWKMVFWAIDCAKHDTAAAIMAIRTLAAQSLISAPSQPPSAGPIVQQPPLPQLEGLETKHMSCIDDLANQKQIHGSQLTLEELLNLIEEGEVSVTGCEFPCGDDDITAQVLQEQGGDEVEEDEDEDGDGDEKPKEVMWPKDALNLCVCMEQLCLEYVNLDVSVLNLQTQICKI